MRRAASGIRPARGRGGERACAVGGGGGVRAGGKGGRARRFASGRLASKNEKKGVRLVDHTEKQTGPAAGRRRPPPPTAARSHTRCLCWDDTMVRAGGQSRPARPDSSGGQRGAGSKRDFDSARVKPPPTFPPPHTHSPAPRPAPPNRAPTPCPRRRGGRRPTAAARRRGAVPALPPARRRACAFGCPRRARSPIPPRQRGAWRRPVRLAGGRAAVRGGRWVGARGFERSELSRGAWLGS